MYVSLKLALVAAVARDEHTRIHEAIRLSNS
jgi:hypothetical protein